MNKRFHFTFGRDKLFPFQDGWVTVEAPTRRAAAMIFKELYPNPRPNSSDILNCSFLYDENDFVTTEMFKETDNYGHGCHRLITLNIKDCDAELSKDENVSFTLEKEINGQTVSVGLTRQDMFLVSEAYQHLCDVETIEYALKSATGDMDNDMCKDKYGITADELIACLEDIAYEMRRQMDKYDLDQDDAIEEAIRIVIGNDD